MKYLGMLIDEVLSWNKQMVNIRTKLARANDILSKLRHVVAKITRASVHFFLLYSHLLNGCLVWSYSTKHNNDQTIKLQKWYVQIITCSEFNGGTSTFYY